MTTTLNRLHAGAKAEVTAVGGEQTPVRRRLLDMGIIPGVSVEVIRTAPLGDPMEIRLRGYALTIRKADAELIEVQGKE